MKRTLLIMVGVILSIIGGLLIYRSSAHFHRFSLFIIDFFIIIIIMSLGRYTLKKLK